MMEWKPKPNGTIAKHWLDLEFIGSREEYNTPVYSAAVKWDGCILFSRYYNGVDYMVDSADEMDKNTDILHICDIDELIESLTKLRDKAKEHFGKDWV